MADIDREKVIKGLKLCVVTGELCGECPYDGMESCIEKLHDDALAMLKEHEAVVRCKDCKYAYLTDDGECKYCEMEKDDNGFLIEKYRSWDWFCADGERRGSKCPRLALRWRGTQERSVK